MGVGRIDIGKADTDLVDKPRHLHVGTKIKRTKLDHCKCPDSDSLKHHMLCLQCGL